VVGNGRNTFFWTDKWLGEVPLRRQFSRLFELSMRKDCTVEDMARLGWEEEGNGWMWRRRLLAWEEESVRECVMLLHHVVLQDDIQDHWRWLIDPIHGYTVRGTYRLLTSSDDHLERSTVSNVWHKLVPSKVSLFAWRLLQNRIPTKANLVHRRVLQPNVNLCVGGCGFIETADHLFLRCNLFGSVWGLVCQWLGVTHVSPSSIPEHFLQFVHLAGLPHATNFYLKVIWLACVWALWKERNNCIFNNAGLDPLLVVQKVKLHSFFWLSLSFEPVDFGFHDWWRHPLLCMGVM